MASKYLNSLSKEKYDKLTGKLHSIQNKKCYICGSAIDLKLHNTNIDHIIPLANRGKDSEDNFAITHESCNKSKQDANLDIARILHRLKKIQDKTLEQEGKAASLKHVLQSFDGSKYYFKYKTENDSIAYSFSDIGNNTIIKVPLFEDNLSKEKTCFIEVPIAYIHHDEIINPRGINNSISKLIKEFEKGNPQLHLTIARINDGKIMIFDVQLWQNVENFLDHLSLLPLWKDRSMAATIFAGKQNYDFWKTVFQTGKSPDGAQVLAKSLNFIDMIKPLNNSENC